MNNEKVIQLNLKVPGKIQPTPIQVTSNGLVYFNLLDQYLRRSEGQIRVIGTLLGVINLDTGIQKVTVTNSYAVPHSEEDELELDVEYHKIMLDLSQKVNPNEVVVGWYCCGPSMCPYSSLIQEFYTDETLGFKPVYLQFNTDNNFSTQFYTSFPIGNPSKTDNCVFKLIPHTLTPHKSELSAMNALCHNNSDRLESHPILSDLNNLKIAITELKQMIVTVLNFIKNGKGLNNSIGRFLIDTLSLCPRMDINSIEAVFDHHLKDILMVAYLANLTRAQLHISKNLMAWS